MSVISTGNQTINTWLKAFNQVSYNNQMLGVFTFHLILGQILLPLKIYKAGLVEDTRVNYFYMQDSGSGKTTALSMVTWVERELGFEVLDNITKLSDTYLTGSYTEDGKGKKKAVHGKLETVDIIHIDEGEIVFHQTEYGKFLVNVLNAVANPYGTAGNKIVVGFKGSLETGEEISFNPHCSVGITSYEPEGVDTRLLRKGLFQRYFFYPRELEIKNRIANAIYDVNNVGKKFNYVKALEPVLEKLHLMKDFVNSQGEIDVSFDRVRPLLAQCITNLYQKIEYIPVDTKKVACEFCARYPHKYYVLCIHHALLNDRVDITREDVIYADSILQEMFTKQLNFIESKRPSYKAMLGLRAEFSLLQKAYQETKITDIKVVKALNLPEVGYALKSDMLKKFCKLKGVSLPTAHGIYRKLKESEQFGALIKEIGGFRNNRKFVKIQEFRR